MSTQRPSKPIEIKISTIVAIAVILHDNQLSVLEAALQDLTRNATDFFAGECAVIDVMNIECATLDWTVLINLLETYGIHPVAIRHAPREHEDQIEQLGLSIDLGTSGQIPEIAVAATPVAAVPDEVAEAKTTEIIPACAPVPVPVLHVHPLPPMIIDTPVRGGQRVYARDTDLIITAVVNSGAEIIADGNIHVYAPLRGRALAGANGNTSARIFTTSLEAELVSIAGIYRTFENGFPTLVPHAPVQIKLNGDKIDVISTHSIS